MERPGFEPPLCAQSTNRSLYAIYSQMPMDNRALFHRRMTINVDSQPCDNRINALCPPELSLSPKLRRK
jgi:hypothetical protein